MQGAPPTWKKKSTDRYAQQLWVLGVSALLTACANNIMATKYARRPPLLYNVYSSTEYVAVCVRPQKAQGAQARRFARLEPSCPGRTRFLENTTQARSLSQGVLCALS